VRSEAYFTGVAPVDGTGAVQIITQGANQLCIADNFSTLVDTVLRNGHMPYSVPGMWDGNTAARITKSINHFVNQQDSQNTLSCYLEHQIIQKKFVKNEDATPLSYF
jgi:hypothetical protein